MMKQGIRWPLAANWQAAAAGAMVLSLAALLTPLGPATNAALAAPPEQSIILLPTSTATPTTPPRQTATPTSTPTKGPPPTSTATSIATSTPTATVSPTVPGVPTSTPTITPSTTPAASGGAGGTGGGESAPAPPATATPTATVTPSATATLATTPAAPPNPTRVPTAIAPAPIQVSRAVAGGAVNLSERFTVAGGQAITLGGHVLVPNGTSLTIRFDPHPPQQDLLRVLANSSGGGAQAVRMLPPIDVQLTADQPITGGEVTILFPYSYLGVDFAMLGDRRFTVLEGIFQDGQLIGLVPTPGTEQPDGWSISVPADSLGFTPFIPVVMAPAWVQNFDPLVHVWSGPTREARDFGFAGPQFTTFTVVAPQALDRLFVYSPVVDNYAWVDVSGVGPSGPPS